MKHASEMPALGVPFAGWSELLENIDRAPVVLRGVQRDASPLSVAAIDEMLAAAELRWPQLRLYRAGDEVDSARYTVQADLTGAGLERITDVDAVLRHYVEGATIQLIGLETYHAPVADLNRAVLHCLADDVARIHTNAYLTPAEAQGFDHHWDTHDVLVLQLEGEKHWQVHGAPLPFPAPDQVCAAYRDEIAQHVSTQRPLIDTVLAPGDVLYLPRGFIHAARTAQHYSLHITLGLHVRSRLHRLEQMLGAALARCGEHEWFTRAVPGAVMHEEAEEVIEELLAQLGADGACASEEQAA
jgi:bifunctional lysine-specific demethylase and histidyl-hydroxylase NO66